LNSALLNTIFLVDDGNRAVIFDKVHGVQDEVKGEGIHFKIPFIQVIFLVIRTKDINKL
jgi:prohibitin 1